MSNASTAKAQAQKARDELASALDAIEDKLNVPKRAQELGKSAMTAYENAKGHADGHAGDAWWHKGNMLWHASREYIRRHANCDGRMLKQSKQSPNGLGELTLSFDLEASALLALRMAADSYRAARPDAE